MRKEKDMQVGIVNFGAYIPVHRMKKTVIGGMWNKFTSKGEKAVANWDEDSLTMAVESSTASINGLQRDSIDGLIFASTTPPYREKQTSSLIRKVLDFRSDVFTTDVGNSVRGGTIGLKIAMNAVQAANGGKYLVAASDLRLSAPNSDLELEFGDGSAALLLGNQDLVAVINDHTSVSSEFIDTWRRDKDAYTQIWEDRFALSEGYQKLMSKSIEDFLKKLGTTPKDYAFAAIGAPSTRALRPVAKMVGFDYGNQISTRLFDSVGNTGTAFPLMLLVEALEKSKPNDRILLAAYGDGVDLFDLLVTEKINTFSKDRGIEKQLSSYLPLDTYGSYIRFRNLMPWGFDRRLPDRTSLPVINRESNQVFSLHGSICRECRTIQYPIQRICTQCQTKDAFDEINLSERKGLLFTFSMDERAMVPDLPNILCIIDLEGGGRYYSVMTDRKPESIQIGMKVEMTFRRIHEGLELYNYFWKTRPVRA